MLITLSSLLKTNHIILELNSSDKYGAIGELVDLLYENKKIIDKKTFLDLVLEREGVSSTGIGKGIAIPHGKSNIVKEISIAFGRSTKGIEFDSLDNKLVHLIFLIAAPLVPGDVYLKVLAQLSRLLKIEEFYQFLLTADSAHSIVEFISKMEKCNA